MTVKLLLLKSGEDVIADVSEMAVGEEQDRKVLGYFLDRPCVVKILNAEKGEDEKSAFNVSLFPWCPLAEDSVIPLPVEWVVTIVEPKQKLKEMYLEDVIGKDSEDSVPDEQADTDQ
jgi:hypothetical protein|tara:strand:+ start:220 stop:570 length:351 start_codon:yes stop_codon:yes gene_type:complete